VFGRDVMAVAPQFDGLYARCDDEGHAMARNFLFGLGWMLVVTAILGLLPNFAPDNKTEPVITYSALGFRVLAAIVMFYFANKCAAAENRWPAVGMWLLGFVVGFPPGILVITGAVFAAWHAGAIYD
jgi:hypothetical protein